MQELWQVLPDPLKIVSIVMFVGLFTAMGLPLSLALWQVALDFVHPLTGEKFRHAVNSCFPPENDNNGSRS